MQHVRREWKRWVGCCILVSIVIEYYIICYLWCGKSEIISVTDEKKRAFFFPNVYQEQEGSIAEDDDSTSISYTKGNTTDASEASEGSVSSQKQRKSTENTLEGHTVSLEKKLNKSNLSTDQNPLNLSIPSILDTDKAQFVEESKFESLTIHDLKILFESHLQMREKLKNLGKR